MSLDFQSMQSIDNLASLIHAGVPNQVPKAEMKNMDWGSQGVGNSVPSMRPAYQDHLSTTLPPQPICKAR